MKMEHVGLNVAQPVAMAAWYVEHLGMRAVRSMDTEPYTHFLADSSGTVMVEIYTNPPDRVPDYAGMDPLLLHLAFVSDRPEDDKRALLAAGATLVEEIHAEDGSHLVMLRDPWGLPIQLCRRGIPMIPS